MKGLLVKDLQILRQQRKFLLVLLVVIVIFMSSTTSDSSFIIAYSTFMSSMLILGTVSYDELENGYAFLFTLPVTRKSYVVSKYVLSLLGVTLVWAIATTFCIVLTTNGAEAVGIEEILMLAVPLLAVCLMILFIMLPIQMKFGAEKSRIVLIGMAGGIVMVGYLIKLLAEKLEVTSLDVGDIIAKLAALDTWSIMAIIILLTAGVMLIAMRISIRIMEKKEL